MGSGTRRGRLIAIGALVAAALVLLSLTGPRPDQEISGAIRRRGGVCLQLEKWGLFGWSVVGQTHTVADIQTGTWRPAIEDPPCAEVPDALYLVRLPFDAPNGTYRICGLDDDRTCIEFRRVPFTGTPGP